MSVYRIYVEKKPTFDVEAKSVKSDLVSTLGIQSVENVRVLNRYDVEGISREVFDSASKTVFSEPAADVTFFELPETAEDESVFAVEYLPGQFDQRADSCEQCIQLMTQGDRPSVKSAKIYILSGDITPTQLDSIKHFIINPVESREASLETVQTLKTEYDIPSAVKTLIGFTELGKKELKEFIGEYGLAMDEDDIEFCRDYFKNTEHRDPTITEIKMIDTYWSDHCRHTTFSTNIKDVQIEDSYIQAAYDEYLGIRNELYSGRTDKPETLMDLAVIGAKKLKKDGFLTDLDESEEINACSVKIDIEVDSKPEKWLLMFKNETHNHPTEIEPFGGAATCLGGAIRDPLSGRSYVYQAMRVTGAADPLVPIEKTIAGKLPQKKIVTTAANGYSSYGNQIGLATGHVAEIYHPGYVAKRMEIGAVVGAAPEKNVVRERPCAGDIIILLGGKTGRDGCGGATGSSKSHTASSLETCGAEVQKGNPPEERKLQRLFRNGEVTRLIKRCNDFGAGGVSVAIGELADGLHIDLNRVPKKYEGLDGTELAISESQERMAVVVSERDVDKFISYAHSENLLATPVATVTEQPRLTMEWNGAKIVDLSREFLNSNGAPKETNVKIKKVSLAPINVRENTKDGWKAHLSDLNICSQKGLSERFDSTIGAGSVLMPFGGKHQLTPAQSMAAKIPVLHGETDDCSLMGWGFNPYLSEQSPFHGAQAAVIESVAKIIAIGGSYKKCWLTFQEYFERTQNNPERWGKPMAALLGALRAQNELKIASIGGKDSMSGTFEDIDVPPTLVSFAVSVAKADSVISPEFKNPASKVYLITPKYDENGLPDYASVSEVFDKVEQQIANGNVSSAWALSYGGVAEAVAKMAFGNGMGFRFTASVDKNTLFNGVYGGFVLEAKSDITESGFEQIGLVTADGLIDTGKNIFGLDELLAVYEEKLEPVFPCNISFPEEKATMFSYEAKSRKAPAIKTAKPKVLIPVFPGTNCEYETARAFEKAGAVPEIFVVKNLSGANINESVKAFSGKIKESQIIMIPGGFSGGDEPDGSGKFITAFFRNPSVKDAVNELIKNRDGLMLGICNGFQALIKLGLVPFGEIVDMNDNSPTLTFNTINRHQSMMVRTRVASDKSPWFAQSRVGDIHTVAISHGEGRFVSDSALIRQLAGNGQIATQYVDLKGVPTYDIRHNPNASVMAIEGITSPDGRILGKMGHSERIGRNLYRNIVGETDQKIFKSGVEYFK